MKGIVERLRGKRQELLDRIAVLKDELFAIESKVRLITNDDTPPKIIGKTKQEVIEGVLLNKPEGVTHEEIREVLAQHGFEATAAYTYRIINQGLTRGWLTLNAKGNYVRSTR